MDEGTRRKIAEGLKQDYMPRHIPGGFCAKCGAADVPMSLHIFNCVVDDDVSVPNWFVAMSSSRGTLRGRAPICTKCAPACKKCGLPIPRKAVLKLKEELKVQLPGADPYVSVGNGVCKDHFHWSALF